MPTYSKIILTKSGVSLKEPNSADLDYGELAINYTDGKLFFKNDSDIIKTISSESDLTNLINHRNATSGNPHAVTSTDIGLGNVSNVPSLDLPISTSTQSALNLKANASDISGLNTLTGLTLGSSDLGVFTGSTISDNTTLKDAFQDLETEAARVDNVLVAHAGNTSNPHNVTKTQLGLSNVDNKSSVTIRSEIVDSDIPSTITRDTELDSKLTEHTDNISNPHGVTKTQVGLSNVDNKSSVTIRSEIVDSDIPSTITRDTELVTHTDNTSNPHNVTKTQLGLVIGTDVQEHDTVLDNTTASFTTALKSQLDGLGTISTQDATNVAITGGTISGLTSLESTSIVSAQTLGFKNTPTNAVTQVTSITTGVTINSPAGTITCVGHTFASATPETFIVTNSTVDETDVIILSFKNGVSQLIANVTSVSSGSFSVSIFDVHNQAVDTTSNPLEINFAVIKHDIT